jgi:hypothetical protein
MQHHIPTVADNNFFNRNSFLAFAIDNKEKFHVSAEEIAGNTSVYISTWYVDDLVAAYREHEKTLGQALYIQDNGKYGSIVAVASTNREAYMLMKSHHNFDQFEQIERNEIKPGFVFSNYGDL